MLTYPQPLLSCTLEGFQPEVTLYRDTAGWCPYCQKVWLLLEEKQIPYKVSWQSHNSNPSANAYFFILV